MRNGHGSRTGTRHGIDHLVRNVETGRFERSLSALTAVGSLVTAAEIYFEHDKASFGNRLMWLPVALGPVGAAAGVAGVLSQRMAKTALPVASAAIVANGLQGTYLHARGIAQKPGGWSNTRYNMEMGPPLLAPLLVTMVGGMGLLAAILRRERVSRLPEPAGGDRFPGFDVMAQARHWDPATTAVVAARLGTPPTSGSSPRRRRRSPSALCDQLLDQRTEPRVPVVAMVDARLAERQTDGWHYEDMPPDGEAWRESLADLDADAALRCGTRASSAASWEDQTAIVQGVQDLGRDGGTGSSPGTCGACGPATSALPSTPTPGPGRRSASAGPPTRAGTRTWASTGASRTRCATPARAPTRSGARADDRDGRGPGPQRVRVAAPGRPGHPARAARGHAPLRGRGRGGPGRRRLRRRWFDPAAAVARAGWRAVALDAGPFWEPETDWVSDEAGSHHLYWTEPRVICGPTRCRWDPTTPAAGSAGRWSTTPGTPHASTPATSAPEPGRRRRGLAHHVRRPAALLRRHRGGAARRRAGLAVGRPALLPAPAAPCRWQRRAVPARRRALGITGQGGPGGDRQRPLRQPAALHLPRLLPAGLQGQREGLAADHPHPRRPGARRRGARRRDGDPHRGRRAHRPGHRRPLRAPRRASASSGPAWSPSPATRSRRPGCC